MKVTVTGHRTLTDSLKRKAIELGKNLSMDVEVERIFVGGARGTDTEVLKSIIETCGEEKTTIVVPDTVDRQPHEAIEPIMEAHSKGASIVELGLGQRSLVSGYGYNQRNKYMLDHSDVLHAIWDGRKKGGTWNTIKEAKKRGIRIVFV